MKALKIIGIIVAILVAAILIIPLFSPSTAEVHAEAEISLQAEQIFPMVASFKNRDVWDPWVSQDSTTKVSIESKPGYVGSTYSWDGEKLGTGRMEVISVAENEHIQSHLWFGEVEEAALVEWAFDESEQGTKVIWSFSQETAYPLERLGMMFGKVFLKQSFEMGLANLKEFMENFPQTESSLGEITIENRPSFHVMYADGGGTMETLSEQLGVLFGQVYAEMEKQGLQMAGPAYVHYLDFEESSGHMNFRAGMQVAEPGADAGSIKAHSYPEMQMVTALHKGPYEELAISYGKMQKYMTAEGLDVTGEAFEFYLTGIMSEPDQSKWETLIAFPLNPQEGL